MTLRFKQGEIAIFAVSFSPEGQHYVGQEVEVTAVGPFAKGQYVAGKTRSAYVVSNCDYVILMQDGKECITVDWQLRKISPPEEPASLTRTNDEEITA